MKKLSVFFAFSVAVLMTVTVSYGQDSAKAKTPKIKNEIKQEGRDIKKAIKSLGPAAKEAARGTKNAVKTVGSETKKASREITNELKKDTETKKTK
jgi:hypothetical protein